MAMNDPHFFSEISLFSILNGEVGVMEILECSIFF